MPQAIRKMPKPEPMAAATRAITRDVRIDFMGISSYGSGKTTSGEVKITKALDISLQDAHVLIVEDLIDSGVTLGYLMNLMQQRQPKSIKTTTLLEKPAEPQPAELFKELGLDDVTREARSNARSGERCDA